MNFLRLWLIALLCYAPAAAQWGGELHMSMRNEPRTFHPALVEDDASETIRYLTAGVLVRINRLTQELEPELALSWKTARGGRDISFRLRQSVTFSDGVPFAAEDVAYTMEVLLDPNLHSATGDAFRSGSGAVRTSIDGPFAITISFPEPVAGAVRLFDQVAILSRHSPLKEKAVLGPFRVAEHKPGAYVLLGRNPNYWKTEAGRRLPYFDSIRLDILQNRETELLHFRRGELDMISGLVPDHFEQLAKEHPAWVKDAGPSLENEFLWFNMNPSAPLPDFKKAWFRAARFRRAVSHAIHRDDLCRLVYRGHAEPGVGPFPPSNRFWFNRNLKPLAWDLDLARRLLAEEGFRSTGGVLRDRQGHDVEFSVITNAGNQSRERVAAMIQADLAELGIRLNIVTLDFPSLLARIGKTSQYEACLLGLNNVDLDPDGQMNVWLSSSANHPWNPIEKSPETPWEAEIDRLMHAQASTQEPAQRKALFDRVQEIVWDQAPVIYLVNKNALVAVSPFLKNVQPAALHPQLVWNIERISVARPK